MKDLVFYCVILYAVCCSAAKSTKKKEHGHVVVEDSGNGTQKTGKKHHHHNHSMIDYCYKDEDSCGPHTKSWPEICRTGLQQSPIDIPKNASASNVTLLVNLSSYQGTSFKMANNGHSVIVNLENPLAPERKAIKIVQQLGRERRYKFVTAHFHWGAPGSEHTIDGKRYDMELHLVHHLLRFPDLQTAMHSNISEALLIMSVLFESSNDNSGNTTLQPIVDNLLKVHEAIRNGSYITVNKTLDFAALLNSTDGAPEFYKYKGSLTTPGCQEVVVYLISKTIAKTNPSDMIMFKAALADRKGKELTENYKPITPANERKVTSVKAKVV